MNSLFLILTAVLVAMTVLPMLRYEAWWIRGFDFPRLQLCFLLLVLLGLEMLLLDVRQVLPVMLLLAGVLCLLYQTWWILPYSPLLPVEVKQADAAAPGERISIMTANVLTPNDQAGALLDLVHRYAPDILVTLESDDWWQKHLDTLQTDYPHAIKCPRDNLYGMHVYSRLPLKNSRIAYLVEPEIPSMHTLALLPSGAGVRLHFVHPTPPSPLHKQTSSERDAELLVVASSVADTETPTIVAGDLNDVAWSQTTRLFRKISGLLDPRVGRGMFNTYHAEHWFMRWPLDHLFHSAHFRLVRICRLPAFGSDHFPLLTELVLDVEQKNEQDGLAGDRQDEREAQQKMKDENARQHDVPEPEREKSIEALSGPPAGSVALSAGMDIA